MVCAIASSTVALGRKIRELMAERRVIKQHGETKSRPCRNDSTTKSSDHNVALPSGRRIAVLGPMRELGEHSEAMHAGLAPAVRGAKVDKLIYDSIKPGGDVSQFQDLGRKHGVDYVLVTVVSSTEQEYPMTVFLGWTSHAQPGFRRDNWTLIEVALIEAQSGQTLLRAEGRGWATLDRPSAPGINQWYPVVWLRPQEPSRRYWPPTYAGAPNTLRVIAMQEAARRHQAVHGAEGVA